MSNTKIRLGLLGGSFDPIHFGHIKPCIELAEKFHLSLVKLIPCKVSPFKEVTFASAQHRWNMISIITGSSDLFEADAIELERGSPSYTYETLNTISQKVSADTQLFWIMGEDALHGLPNWHQAEKIMQLCHVLVMKRPGVGNELDSHAEQWLKQYMTNDIAKLEESKSGYIHVTDTDMFDISSTQIREILLSGEQPRFLLPGGVWNYIKRNQLYQQSA